MKVDRGKLSEPQNLLAAVTRDVPLLTWAFLGAQQPNRAHRRDEEWVWRGDGFSVQKVNRAPTCN